MNDYRLPARQLPSGSPFVDGAYDRPAADALSLGQIFGVLRRRYRLILLMTVLGIADAPTPGPLHERRDPAVYEAPSKYDKRQKRSAQQNACRPLKIFHDAKPF